MKDPMPKKPTVKTVQTFNRTNKNPTNTPCFLPKKPGKKMQYPSLHFCPKAHYVAPRCAPRNLISWLVGWRSFATHSPMIPHASCWDFPGIGSHNMTVTWGGSMGNFYGIYFFGGWIYIPMGLCMVYLFMYGNVWYIYIFISIVYMAWLTFLMVSL